MTLVAVRDVAKRFGVVQALKGVSLDLPAACVTALVGENGAGKSTLLRILEGEHRPDSGAVLVEGRELRLASARDAHEAGIRVVHQEPEIIPELSVAENVYIGDLRARGGLFVDWQDLAARCRAMLARFGLEGALDPSAPCRGLGPAQRQLIEIMRGLRPGVRLLCLDEPTSSLTEEEAQRLFGIVRALRAEGTGVVYISHRLREVRDLADRVAVLRDGELVGVHDAADVDEALMVRLMVGRDLGDLFAHQPRARDEVVLEARGVTTARVRDCSLAIRAGEVVGLGGLVGAGRSELARALFGADRLTAGEVRMHGRRLDLKAPGDAIMAGIGLVPEDRKQEALLLLRSVRDNISLCVPDKVSRLGFFDRAAESRLVGALSARLSVKTPSIDQEVRKLSGGNQQKVVFARWLAREPRLLILDEPTRGIDVGAKLEIYRLIEELAAAGIAILVISSELPELLGLTDRILVMRGGAIAGEVRTAATGEAEVLALAMGEHHSQRSAA
ncbi:MAG: sugar ABC transporter ATP-binding protein [Geminicoccaceae bacterium]